MIAEEHDFHSNTKQSILQMIAIASEDPIGVGYIKFHQVVMMLKAKLGNDPLKKFWKNDYEENILKLNILGSNIAKLQGYLLPYTYRDNIRKLLEDEDVTSPRFHKVQFYRSKVIQHLDILFESFVCLMMSSSIKDASIDNSYWGRSLKQLMGYQHSSGYRPPQK